MSFAAANPPRARRVDLPLACLLVVLLAGAILRIYGLNWDGGHLFHPDERHILMVSAELGQPWPSSLAQALSPDSTLNPHSFAYGSFIFYLLRLVSAALAWLGGVVAPLAWMTDLGTLEGMRFVGRVLSALFDLGTVYLTFLIGRRVVGPTVGVLAAAFVSFSVLNVQLSHFYASDTLLTCFILLTVWLSLRLTRERGIPTSLLVGVAVGLVLGTKVSGAPVVLAVLVAHGIRLFVESTTEAPGRLVFRRPSSQEVVGALGSLVVTGAATVVTFFVVEPYALLDFNKFMHDVREQSGMVRGILDYPYTRQYIDRPAYWYFIENLSVWGLGLPLGITAFVGFAWAIGRWLFRPRPLELVLLAWVVPYFLITGGFQVKFLRYLLPITPFLLLYGAHLLVAIIGWLRRRKRPEGWTKLAPVLGWGLAAIVLIPTLFYALAYINVYSVPHTGVSASRWMYQNVPPGSTIGTEHWEEGLPVTIREGGRQIDPGQWKYQFESLNLYEEDNQRKLNDLVTKLGKVDYIAFYSQRLYGTIPRLPERYPLSTRYYQLLFSGQLGFQLDASFTSYPNLLGVAFVDDTFSEPRLPTPAPLLGFRPAPLTLNLGRADESFTVYDHPKVLVFKKTENLSESVLRDRLTSGLSSDGGTMVGDTSGPGMLTPIQQREIAAGGTFADMFARDGFENSAPLVVWVVLLVGLGLVMLPASLLAFRALPDAGYGFARTLGVLSLGWLVWMIVSLRLMPNTRLTIAVAFGVLALANIALAWTRRSTLRELLRRRRTTILTIEGAFWGAFVLFLLIRMANPDLWHPALGGEKPMDLAFLNAVMKSTWFPPYDPWFAGGYLNYYYFGQILMGTLVKLSGILPTIAYNLVIPLLFALTFTGAFSVTFNLAGLVRRHSSPRRLLPVGLLGALMAVVLGNLGGAQQILDSLQASSPIRVSGSFPGLQSVVSLIGGTWQMFTSGDRLVIPTDWYWASTRVLDGTINEFPFFSFLYADLHAHLIALPLTTVAMGVALTWVASWRSSEGRGGELSDSTSTPESAPVGWRAGLVRIPIARVVLTALVVGALWATNSWDFPAYMVIVAIALFALWYTTRPRTGRGLVFWAGMWIGIAILSYLLFWPFHSTFESYYFGLDLIEDKSDLEGYLVIHGFLLFGVVSLLGSLAFTGMGRNPAVRVLRLRLAHWDRSHTLDRRFKRMAPESRETLLTMLILVVALALVVAGLVMSGAVIALLVVVFAVAAYLAFRQVDSPAMAFACGIVALGAALGILCEVAAIKGDIGRMNTVFKFYLQVWMMWAAAGAVGLYCAYEALRRRSRRAGRYVWGLVLLGLFLASLTYPLVATPARVANRFDTRVGSGLDGTSYMTRAVYVDDGRQMVLSRDLKAIRWLQDNVPGSPVILEGRAPLYRWGSRVSVYTGLPTVLGWDWHEMQQRAGTMMAIDRRASDVKELYSSQSIEHTLQLLAAYQVRYIYVGDLERAYYPPAGLAKFDAMVGQALRVVYDADGVKIYEVTDATVS